MERNGTALRALLNFGEIINEFRNLVGTSDIKKLIAVVGGIGVDRKIMLKRQQKSGARIWTGFISLKTGKTCWLL
jgi:hypothetical protein